MNPAKVRTNNSKLALRGIQGEFSSIGWRPPGQAMNWNDWTHEFRLLLQVEKGVQFAIGDVLNYGETLFGEDFAAVVDSLNMNPQRLATYKWIAGAFPLEKRDPSLTWSHHRFLATIHNGFRDYALALASKLEWTTRECHLYATAWRTLYDIHEDGRRASEEALEWLQRAVAEDWSPRRLRDEIARAHAIALTDKMPEILLPGETPEDRPAAFQGGSSAPVQEFPPGALHLAIRIFVGVYVNTETGNMFSFGAVLESGASFYAEFLDIDFSRIKPDDEQARATLHLGDQRGTAYNDLNWTVVARREFVAIEFLRWLSENGFDARRVEAEIWMNASTPVMAAVARWLSFYGFRDHILDVRTLLWARGENPFVSRIDDGETALGLARRAYQLWRKAR